MQAVVGIARAGRTALKQQPKSILSTGLITGKQCIGVGVALKRERDCHFRRTLAVGGKHLLPVAKKLMVIAGQNLDRILAQQVGFRRTAQRVPVGVDPQFDHVAQHVLSIFGHQVGGKRHWVGLPSECFDLNFDVRVVTHLAGNGDAFAHDVIDLERLDVITGLQADCGRIVGCRPVGRKIADVIRRYNRRAGNTALEADAKRHQQRLEHGLIHRHGDAVDQDLFDHGAAARDAAAGHLGRVVGLAIGR